MAKKSTCLYIITKSVWGGATKYVYDLSSNLSGNFNVMAAAGGKKIFAQKIIKQKIPYFRITNFQRTINPLKDFFAFFEILGLLFQLKPDVIHVNSSKAGGIVGLAGWVYRILTNREIKLIFTAHGWAFLEDRPKWQIKLIKLSSQLTGWFYDKIVCVSDFDRQNAIKHKISPANKLIAIHNGIDLKTISFIPRQKAQQKILNNKSLPTDRLVIGTIAEWTKNKGLIYLLEAVKTLETRFPKFDLILIGSGENPDKEKMYKFVKEYNLENVHLIEWIDNAATYLKAFDIFVLPSIKEGLPYTIIEAMAAQLSIIATNVGGISEMITDQENGLLVQPKNSRQLAEKITYLLNNPEIAKKLAQKARSKVEREFTLQRMIDQTKDLY
tara:strand:- start:5463 stop:6614 length:1152 start_codon:yes stop_codon:yes gene_type:complete